jgi:glucose-6-phosphate isomerase
MLLKFTRTLKEMLSVLMENPLPTDNFPAYWVFSEVSKKWENMTVISPGNLVKEFPKTYGHYHSTNSNEKYKLLSGQGLLIMQKRKFADDDWKEDQIEKVYFAEFVPGDEITITPEWGHSWSNIGREPLITLDDWKDGHQKSDYELIKKFQGMSYYLVNKNGQAEFIPNKNYKELPKPEWITASDFNKITCE